jgi:hypothetical protein
VLQRSKNLISDVVEKQHVETKNTVTFLKYVLGQRDRRDAGTTGLNSSAPSKLTPMSNVD